MICTKKTTKYSSSVRITARDMLKLNVGFPNNYSLFLSRRWFTIQNNQLVYRKRSKDSLTIMEEDLRLCTVKPAHEIDRRFCFEVVSPARLASDILLCKVKMC